MWHKTLRGPLTKNCHLYDLMMYSTCRTDLDVEIFSYLPYNRSINYRKFSKNKIRFSYEVLKSYFHHTGCQPTGYLIYSSQFSFSGVREMGSNLKICLYFAFINLIVYSDWKLKTFWSSYFWLIIFITYKYHIFSFLLFNFNLYNLMGYNQMLWY